MICPNCGSPDSVVFRAIRDKRDYKIVKCVACNLLFLDSPPSESEIDAIYNSPDYFDGNDAGYQTSYLGQQAAIERDARRRLTVLDSLLGRWAVSTSRAEPRSVLEIGCAAGFFLNVARQRDWLISGVELSSAMADHARGLLNAPVLPSFVATSYAPNSFDAICMWEVIEHLPRPNEMLNDIRMLLKKDGVLALSTPNTGHWQAQRKPEWWTEFKPPAHLVFYTDDTLRDTLQRCGFTRVLIRKTRPNSLSPAMLDTLRKLRGWIGDGAFRRTPFWFMTSGIYRLANSFASLNHLRQENHVGIEAYAQL